MTRYDIITKNKEWIYEYMKRKDISINDKRLLSWLYSDGTCCMCHQGIGFFEQDNFIGEFAHIEDLRPFTSRYNEKKKLEERNELKNIILLCPTCHTTIDKNSDEYSTEKLLDIKNEYEKNIQLSRECANPKFYNEFDIICKELEKMVIEREIEEKYENIKIENKIKRNDLSSISYAINNAIKYVPIYKDYINTKANVEQVDIRQRILQLYVNECKDINKSNVDRFNHMISNIVGKDMSKSFSAMIIVCNYFEECDVFEV